MVGELRSQWIDIIWNHQEWNVNSDDFWICGSHFPKQSFIEEEGRKILKKGSLPLLPIHEIEFVDVNESSHIVEQENEELINVPNGNTNENFAEKLDSSNVVCKEKKCIDAYMELLKLREKLGSLEKAVQSQKVMINMQRTENSQLRKEYNQLAEKQSNTIQVR